MARLPLAFRIGLGLVLFGILLSAGVARWKDSHLWVPLEVPVSLSPGHIRTAPFRTNLAGTYMILLTLDPHIDFKGSPCFVDIRCTENASVLAVQWRVSSGGRVVARGDGGGRETFLWHDVSRNLGAFSGPPGEYSIDLEVREDGSRFNAGAPGLMVMEDGTLQWAVETQADHAYLLSLLLGIAGVLAIVRSTIVWRRKNRTRFAREFSLTQPGPQPRNLQIAPPRMLAPAEMSRLRTPSANLGIFLIIAACGAYAAFNYWLATRTFIAVDQPVSLAPGHLKVRSFKLNLRDFYNITLYPDPPSLYNTSCGYYEVLKTRWVLYSGGNVVADSGKYPTQDGSLSGFTATSGFYDLDVEVLPGATCLDSVHPRLKVFAESSGYKELATPLFWICALSAGAGVSLLVIAWHRDRTPHRSVSPRLSGLPSFGIMAGNFYLLMFMIVLILRAAEYYPTVGLQIRLLKPEVSAERSPGIQPLLITLRPGPLIDSQPVRWEDFDAVVRRELDRRPPDWPVYLEGDRNMEWRAAVNAVDRIRGLHAEVILLTRRNR